MTNKATVTPGDMNWRSALAHGLCATAVLGACGLLSLACGLAEASIRHTIVTAANSPEIGDEQFARAVIAYQRPGGLTGGEAVRVSPDGRMIAFEVGTQVGSIISNDWKQLVTVHDTLFVREAERSGNGTPIGPPDVPSWGAVWDPNGATLAFYSLLSGVIRVGVYDLKTRKYRFLTTHPVSIGTRSRPSRIVWSADGRSIYLVTAAQDESGGQRRGSDVRGPERQGAPLILRTGRDRSLEVDAPPRAGLVGGGVTEQRQIISLEVESGKTTVLVEGQGADAPLEMIASPHAKWIGYTSNLRNSVFNLSGDVPDGVAILPVTFTVISATNGRRMLTIEDVEHDQILWSPLGERVVFKRGAQLWTSNVPDGSGRSAGAARRLAANVGKLGFAAFAADGSKLIVGANSHLENSAFISRDIAVAPLDGGPAEIVRSPDRFRLVKVITDDDAVAWQPEARYITALFQEENTGDSVAVRVAIDSVSERGGARVLWRGREQLSVLGISPDDRKLFVTGETLVDPPEMFVYDERFRHRRAASSFNSAAARRPAPVLRFLHTHVRSYDRSMITVRSALVLPPNTAPGSHLPLIVMQYPGAELSNEVWSFPGPSAYFPVAILLHEGYGVLLADFPVRTGDGSIGNRIVEAADLLMPQIYHAMDQSEVDSAKVVLYGHSQGAMMASMLATHTGLFAAIIETSGPLVDYPASYGYVLDGTRSPNIGPMVQANLGKDPWSDFLRYLAISPYYQAQRITSPIFVAYGAKDQGLWGIEAGKFFSALYTLNKDAEVLEYPDEAHTLWVGKLEDALDLYHRIDAFLDRHLNLHENTEVMSSGRSHG